MSDDELCPFTSKPFSNDKISVLKYILGFKSKVHKKNMQNIYLLAHNSFSDNSCDRAKILADPVIRWPFVCSPKN